MLVRAHAADAGSAPCHHYRVLHILCLHEVVKRCPVSPWSVTEDEVDRIIEDYRANGFSTITLDDLPRIPQRALAVTVDDGRAGAVAWLLGRAPATAVSATVFVVPDWIDRPYLIPETETYSGFGTWEQVAALRTTGHCIGSHTMTHRPLPTLAIEQIHHELKQSKLRICEAIGFAPLHLAAPYGKVDATVIDAAKEAGYQTICLTEPGINGEVECESGLLRRWVLRRDRAHLGLPGRPYPPR